MMPPEHRFDLLLRRRLQRAEVPPPPAVWEGVERQLRRRRRRRTVLWCVVGLLLMGGGWLGQRAGLFYPAPSPSASENAVQPFPVLPPPSPRFADEKEEGQPAVSSSLPTGAILSRKSTLTATPAARTSPVEASDLLALFAPPAADVSALPLPSTEPLPTLPGPSSMPVLQAHREPQLSLTAQKPPKGSAKNTRKCYRFGEKGSTWLIHAYAGPSKALARWRNLDVEMDSYAAARRRTEAPEGAFNAGVRLSCFPHPNIAVRTGLQYDQWIERFEYTNPDFIRYHVVITQKLINGQWVSVADTVGVEYGAEYLRVYNRFGLLNIPVQIGLEWRKGAVGISVNAEASVNLLFHKRGTILDADGKPTAFTPGAGGRVVYRTRTGLSIGGSVQGFYHLAPRTRLFAEPYFHSVLRPITLPDYPIEQRQCIAGLRIGISQILGQ